MILMGSPINGIGGTLLWKEDIGYDYLVMLLTMNIYKENIGEAVMVF